MNDLHDFLVGDGGLKSGTEQIPKIRKHIEGMPKTASTFRISKIGVDTTNLRTDKLIEFAGAWRIPEGFGLSQQKGRVFVNPDGAHATTFTDCIVECQCGANFSKGYDDNRYNLRDEDSHYEHCKPWWRLEARAEMARKREEIIIHCGKLGWSSTQIGPRIGMSHNSIGAMAQRNNTSMKALRDEYRRLAGNTYAHLVRTLGESSEAVGEAYGHNRSTLGRWARVYGDYEPEKGFNIRTRTSTGEYMWKHREPAKVPDFIAGDD